jgi:predicted aldo/keto reductase-like oxidoreductase
MQAFKEAKEIGLIKHIGMTAHEDVRVLQRAVELTDDIESLLLPVNVGAKVEPNPVNDYTPLLKLAREKNLGVTAIKAISKGRWKKEAKYNTWYEPLEDQDLINQAINFTLSQEGVSTYSLPCDIKLWPLIFNAVTKYRKLDKKEQEQMISLAREKKIKPLFPEISS